MTCGRCISLGFVAAALWLAGPSRPALGQCQGWLPGEGASITAGEFRAATMFDPDGEGPLAASLVVGGNFADLIGSYPMIRDLASWDGSRWTRTLPSNDTFLVNALTVFDLDGSGPNPPRLIVGGQFRARFPPQQQNIFAFDGQTAIALGEGLNGEVLALHVFDPDGDGPSPAQLYAGGRFSLGVARWNGMHWESPAPGLSGYVKAFTTYDPDGPGSQPPLLVAGGHFGRNGTSANIAGLSGTEWVSIGGWLNGDVMSLTTFDFDGESGQPARLLAAGEFTGGGGSPTLRGQGYFDGTSWRPIAPLNANQPFSTGRALGVFDPDGNGGLSPQLFLAGSIRLPNSQVQRSLVTYQDGAWVPTVPNSTTGQVLSMTQLMLPGENEPVLFITGTLTGTQPQHPLRLGVIDGDGPRPFQNGFTGMVRDLAASSVGGVESVVAVGTFSRIPGSSANGIAYHDGTGWSTFGSSASGNSYYSAVYSYDPDDEGPMTEVVVVGGSIPSLGNVMRWNGTEWSGMGSGVPYVPTQFVQFDSDGPGGSPGVLIAAGHQMPGGPGSPGYLMQWDGQAWTQLGPEFVSVFGPAQVSGVATMDPDGAGPLPRVLIVSGLFSRVGTVQALNVVSFDGHQWRPLGSGLNTNTRGLYTWDRAGDGHEVVVIGGYITSAGGVPAHGVAVWNGTEWSTLGSGFGTTSFGSQTYPDRFLSVDIDGAGPEPSRLYATGYFTEASGAPAAGIARWNGMTWEPVGSGLDASAGSALAMLRGKGRPPTLFVGGGFQSAGGVASSVVARYSVVACCSSDFNADGYLTTQDLFEFLEAFFAGAPAADINHDSFTNSADFFQLLTGLFIGC
ncbi:MAG: hypothetical protein H7210_10710 [Pyrinomonadaceae bacterium]|nr:hypothetical protein [Phycisphaerales bacterium]